MKIIKVDNFGREYIADKLIAENVDSVWDNHIINFLNDAEGEDSPNYFMLVEDDYNLWRGMEELM